MSMMTGTGDGFFFLASFVRISSSGIAMTVLSSTRGVNGFLFGLVSMCAPDHAADGELGLTEKGRACIHRFCACRSGPIIWSSRPRVSQESIEIDERSAAAGLSCILL